MKPVVKKIIIISSAVVAALLVAVLVLSLIVVKPIEELGGYDRIYVLERYNSRMEKNDELLNQGMESVKFSVMRSLLEFQADYKIKPVTVKDDNDEDVQKKYSVENFSDIRPKNGEYMIELFYDKAQTNKRLTDDDGKEIIFDTVILVIPASENTIQDVRIFPYLRENMENGYDWDKPDDKGRIGSRYYNIYEFTAKMYTYSFYETIKDFYPAGSSGVVA